MSTYLRKCIDIAPTGIASPEQNPPNHYLRLRQQAWWPALRATTSWIRLEADWYSLQRVEGDGPGSDPASALCVRSLDEHVETAHADGLKIILMPYRYPRWANGTDRIVELSDEDFDLAPWDRVSRLSDYLGWRAGTRPRPTYKTHAYRMPAEGHGPGTAWTGFVEWLWQRYADRIAAFEVVNEPNGQLWPQRTQVDTEVFDERWGTTGTTLASARETAQMMITVDEIARRYPDGPLLLAPSTSDTLQNTFLRTTTISHTTSHAPFFDPFVERLLYELDQRAFMPDDRWIWAFHNYTDTERRYHFAPDLRRILRDHGWRGRQLDGGPEMWATEGGCRPQAMNTRFGLPTTTAYDGARLDYQARVLTESLSRHHYAKGAGAGIGMLTQYTTYADGFNSGVLNGDGTLRPAFDSWCAVPEYHAAPVQRAAWRPQF